MTAATVGTGRPSRPAATRRLGRLIDRWLLPLYAAGVTTYLILPVAVMILFSFNDPTGRSNLNFRQFSLDAWLNPLGRPGLEEAVRNSLVVAAIATVVSTILGTMIALALVRYTFRGRGISRQRAERAVALSVEKYCSVLATVRGVATVETEVVVIDDPADEAEPGQDLTTYPPTTDDDLPPS